MDGGIALEDGNVDADMEMIVPIPVPLFGLDLLGLTKRTQNGQDNSVIDTYMSGLNDIQL